LDSQCFREARAWALTVFEWNRCWFRTTFRGWNGGSFPRVERRILALVAGESWRWRCFSNQTGRRRGFAEKLWPGLARQRVSCENLWNQNIRPREIQTVLPGGMGVAVAGWHEEGSMSPFDGVNGSLRRGQGVPSEVSRSPFGGLNI
jgi:hypothetical protein